LDRVGHGAEREVFSSLGPGSVPLHLGGLGVLDLRILGIALKVRWLWL
jgi:hypothetical protein